MKCHTALLALVGGIWGMTLLPQAARGDDFEWKLRYQRPLGDPQGNFETRMSVARWPAQETAFIVCDVWDQHHCLNAVRRLTEFAPRLNAVLVEARRRGAIIIHAPSDCMPAYEGHAARARAIAAPPAANAPRNVAHWCSRIPAEEAAVYPLDQSDGGEDDDPQEHARWAAELKAMGRNPSMPWKTQSPLIEIDSRQDFISDRGDEVWNILESRGVKNVVLVGVHLNMCVLGRPFGLRQLVRGGKRVALMRDMTDCMYNPARWPFVDHFTGNDLMVTHVERYICPTLSSDQLLGGEEFRSKMDRRPAGQPARPQAKPPEWSVFDWSEPSMLPFEARTAETIWLRCVVRIPKAWLGDAPLRLQMARSMSLTAWLNGKAAEPDEPASLETVVRFPAEAIAVDDANLLVIRLNKPRGAARLSLGPLLSADSRPLPLSGRWQIRAGDNPAWSNIPLPAKFGGAPDIFFEPRE